MALAIGIHIHHRHSIDQIRNWICTSDTSQRNSVGLRSDPFIGVASHERTEYRVFLFILREYIALSFTRRFVYVRDKKALPTHSCFEFEVNTLDEGQDTPPHQNVSLKFGRTTSASSSQRSPSTRTVGASVGLQPFPCFLLPLETTWFPGKLKGMDKEDKSTVAIKF
jgi:hypothetical protein